MNELALVEEILEGELLDGCEIGRSVCTNTGVELVEDPYESDVHNNPGVLIMACPACLHELYLDI